MTMARDPICMGCGQPTGPGPRLNTLPDGRTCTSCQDRLLESLPPVLPSTLAELSFGDWSDAEDSDEDFLEGA